MFLKKYNFIDTLDIIICSGNGGRGSVHFRHERGVNKGGPDGGDGGNGGSIIFVCNYKLSTLFHLRHHRHYFAENGKNGGGSKKHGKDAKDIFIEVPKGTIIIDKDSNKQLCEMLEDQQQYIALKGGRGGLGNTHFKTSTNRAPRYAQEGEKGQKLKIKLDLKLLADIGLVGFPNVGKSTFLSTISSARVEVGNYNFTTLIPRLGVVRYNNMSLTIADLPGIIEGAATGRGLGIQFLKHIEHVKCLCFMLDATKNYIDTFHSLQKEIRDFNSEILNKKQIIVITKCDLIDNTLKAQIKANFKKENINPIFISSKTQIGIKECLNALFAVYKSLNV